MPPHLPENQLIGPYRVVRLIGEGGMGAVYEAQQDTIGRRVALKILHPQYAADPDVMVRFFNEARAVNIIAHPGLVQVSDFGTTEEGIAYLVMEFLSGETLGDRMGRLGRLPLHEALQLAAQFAAALAAAHAHNIVHRDLKPQNVLIVPNPAVASGEQIKIVDFGIAKLLDANQGGAGLTETGKILGTPQYMAPEQAKTTRVDGRADVYAVGTILFAMVAGRLPFPKEKDDTAWAVLARKMADEPLDLALLEPSLPKEVSRLVMSMLVRNPAARPTMAEVDAALCRMLGLDPRKRSGLHTPVGVDPPTVSEVKTLDAPSAPAPKQIASPSAPTLGRPIRQSIGLGVLALLLVGSAVTTWALLSDRRPAPTPTRNDFGPPADLLTPPPDLEVRLDLSSPPDMARPLARPKLHCVPRPITDSCILTPMATQQKMALVTALRENGGVLLCLGERLAITGLPRHPNIQGPASWLKRQTPGPFNDALLGLDGSFPATVEILCQK